MPGGMVSGASQVKPDYTANLRYRTLGVRRTRVRA